MDGRVPLNARANVKWVVSAGWVVITTVVSRHKVKAETFLSLDLGLSIELLATDLLVHHVFYSHPATSGRLKVVA